MEQSPLTQQARPGVFEPKVVTLYRRLFREVEDDEKPEGFWTELFLLRPDTIRLRQILQDTDSDFLLHVQNQPQQLLLQAIAALKLGRGPADEHALDTLTVFFAVVLAKKYTNPSSDIIEVLAGLDSVDAVFTELVSSLDHIIKDGRSVSLRQKAVKTAIAVVSGGYQTALVSYFIQRDFFPGLMRLVQQVDSSLQASEPLLLAGLLANYGKFETHNQYRVRLSDFVNDEAMKKVVESVGWTSTLLRARYVTILDDTPVGWTVTGTLSYVGLGALAGAKSAAPTLTEEQQKEFFAEQPGTEASVLLTVYDFTLANKLFCHHLVTQEALDKGQPPPFSALVSFMSYLYQQAYRSARASLYTYLSLLILLILVEDSSIAKLLCERVAPVRLSRQRQPYLPLSKGDRTYAANIIDLLADGVNHNLRKRLDTELYIQTLAVLSRLISYLAKSRTKLAYHWSELWRILLTFARFLNQYSEDLSTLPGATELVQELVELLYLAMTAGEAFLPDASAYDDLFYKLVESGEALSKLRDTYRLATAEEKQSPINTLIGVSQHYNELIDSHKAKKEHLSPREINKIIKQGYETLSIDAKEGSAEQTPAFREADYKAELKKIVRVAVADAAAVVNSSGESHC